MKSDKVKPGAKEMVKYGVPPETLDPAKTRGLESEVPKPPPVPPKKSR